MSPVEAPSPHGTPYDPEPLVASAGTAVPDTVHYRLRSLLDLRLAAADLQRLPALAQCSPVDRSLLATLVSELGSNILKYAGNGHIRVRSTPQGQRIGVEVVAEDQGPGIRDVALAMQDHYSSSGTLGLGLSGVRRMSSQFQIESAPGQGCRVRAHKWMPLVAPLSGASAAVPFVRPQPALPPLPVRPTAAATPPAEAPSRMPESALRFDAAERNRPCRSELVSGDSTLVCPVKGGLLLAVIDAAGHGPRAHAVAQTLAHRLQSHASADLRRMLQMLHDAAVGTVGAAAALVLLDPHRGMLRMVGVGNIRVRCLGTQSWVGISRNGILGERFSLPEVQECALHAGDVVLLYSDGIREHLDRQLLVRAHLGSAHTLAHALLQQGARTTDDASCVVVLCKH